MPKCRNCKYRRGLIGSAHSACYHPLVKDIHQGLGAITAIFASVGRTGPQIHEAVIELGIKANPHGVQKGWFNWPWNFDPAWLISCGGFDAKDEA